MNVTFLGLGSMGRPMAERLVQAGHLVTVWNRTAERTRDLVAAGAHAARTPADAVRGASAIILMLADPAAVENVLSGGDQGALRAIGRHSLVIDCSTIGPAGARREAELLAGVGARFVDAPVLGSTPAAKSGKLTVLAGGDPRDVSEAEPLLRTFGTVVQTGPVGSGNALKLVMNLLVGGLTELLGEAIVLAERSGLPNALVQKTLSESVLMSPFLRYKAPQLFDRNFAPLFSAALMRKDLDLILAQARDVGASLPATAVIREQFARAAEAHGTTKDMAVVLEALES